MQPVEQATTSRTSEQGSSKLTRRRAERSRAEAPSNAARRHRRSHVTFRRHRRRQHWRGRRCASARHSVWLILTRLGRLAFLCPSRSPRFRDKQAEESWFVLRKGQAGSCSEPQQLRLGKMIAVSDSTDRARRNAVAQRVGCRLRRKTNGCLATFASIALF